MGSSDLINCWIFIIERTLMHTEQFLFILGCSVEWLPWRTYVQLHPLPIHSSGLGKIILDWTFIMSNWYFQRQDWKLCKGLGERNTINEWQLFYNIISFVGMSFLCSEPKRNNISLASRLSGRSKTNSYPICICCIIHAKLQENQQKV